MARKWKPDKQFEKYATFIAEHPNYKGMPDLYWDKEKKRIQWEAPSNRGGGKFEHSHTKRLDWWKKKAVEIGIDPERINEWISKTAKAIHPTGKKPCKVCGRVMDIRYSYPSLYLIRRIKKLDYIPEEYIFDELEHIKDLITRLITDFGDQVYDDLPNLFRVKNTTVPKMQNSLKAWLEWVENVYIPTEPSMLSPGAMSNAPDRLDGFHTFNRCCRSTADKGRHKENLRLYTTDRRVFEYWNDGNWVAANKLMGLVKTKFESEGCLNGHASKSSADHIGPLSLGFSHRPKFQLLCNACNSGKGNRMMLSDVEKLKKAEKQGEIVVSWYARRIWDLRKDEVDSTELALRLSKLMRDNWYHTAYLLGKIAESGNFIFLVSLMSLGYTDFNYSFNNLRVKSHVTKFDSMSRTRRNTKYAVEQKARAVRVALESLLSYDKKENRSLYLVQPRKLDKALSDILKVLDTRPKEVKRMDSKIESLLSDFENFNTEDGFRKIVQELPKRTPSQFEKSRILLLKAINSTAEELSKNWESSRYVRNDSVFE